MTRRMVCLCGWVLMALGAILRVANFGRALEYDEIWTLEHYSLAPVSVIFTELGLPNNHPLNSLLIKISVWLFGPGVLALRLPSLLAGLALLWLSWKLAERLFRNRLAGLLALALTAFAPLFVVYSQVARGYELQLALLTGAFLALLNSEKRARRAASGTGRAAVGWIAAAVLLSFGAMLTLPTSAVYLGSVTVILLAGAPKNRRYWSFAAIAGSLALGWLFWNYSAFRAGQVFGTPIVSVGGFFRFAGNTLGELLLFPPLAIVPLAGLFFRRTRRVTGGIWLAAGLIFLSALATRAGGARVYQGVLFLLIPAAAGTLAEVVRRVHKTWFRRSVLAGTAGAALGLYEIFSPGFFPPDWCDVFADAKAFPRDTLVVFGGNAAVAVEWNNRPEAVRNFAWRLAAGHDLQYLLQLESAPGCLNGLDEAGGETLLPLGFSGEPVSSRSLSGEKFRLKDLRTPPENADAVVLAVFPPQPEKLLYLQCHALRKLVPNWLLVNQPFSQDIPSAGGVLRCRVFAIRNSPRLDWPELLKRGNPNLRFFLVY